jgi:hypothetical protein
MRRESAALEKSCPSARTWKIVGGLLALGIVVMFVRELPALRRELKLLRM